jgi:hypothetical protein
LKIDVTVRPGESRLEPSEKGPLEGNATPFPGSVEATVAHSKQRVIGSKQRLSESVLWQIQRNFYSKHSGQAWRAGTLPLEITSNPLIARAYARVIYGFWKDSGRAAGSPLRILELGAGHGRFGYLFLCAFEELHRRLSPPGAVFQYVMTDGSETNLEFLMSHPKLQRFVDAGVLEFALFDVERDGSPRPAKPGNAFAGGQAAGPVAVIANYLLDSIPADAFYVKQDELFERLVTVQAADSWPDWTDPGLLSKLCISCTNHPVQADYYPEPGWNHILEQYRKVLAEASLLFPVAALRCIERLHRAAAGNFLLLAADKGAIHEDELLPEEGIPGMAVHAQGCFSLDVNFDAIARYFRSLGGVVLNTPQHAVNLNVVAFVVIQANLIPPNLIQPNQGQPNQGCAETSQAFEDFVHRNGPDDFFTLEGALESVEPELTLDQILAYLRASAWNPKVFLDSFSVIMRAIPQATAPNKQDLYQAALRIWDAYYSIGEETDLEFHLGVLLLETGFCKEAMHFFRDSVSTHGPQCATSYNLGLCFFGLGQMKEALAQMDEALKFDDGYELARAMRTSLMSALGQSG